MPSSKNVPSSMSRARRSRAVSLSAACWASIFSCPPPSLAFSRRAARSSASERSGGRSTRVSAAARAGRSSVAAIVGKLLGGKERGDRLHHEAGQLRVLEACDLQADQLARLGHGV